ncbi:cold-shock protein [Thiotrichales bacterium 19S9-12]|nr:cold-shock protein [Thiotrichales bacterium 19S9-11]MCF6812397.1 cold-shock protein [Thiotrichales bacterium 19S9-12]
MTTGTVKFFNTDKGFGFIKPDDGSKDLFFHKNDILEIISDNDKVQYEVTKTQKGPAATGVKKI